MSTVPHESASTTDQPLANLLFDYPSVDIILRSQDCFHFRVPQTTIVNNSVILGDIIRKALKSTDDANPEESLMVVQLPERGEILRCLLTFIYPVTPLLPSTPEDVMELLSVTQKYQMEAASTHIRGSISLQNSLPLQRLESALHIYSLAQKYGLRTEALQAAQAILLKQPMTIEALGNELDIMSGASLYELWKYYERVRAILASDLTEFRRSFACGTITGLRCEEICSQIPSWLYSYIESIKRDPNLFDSARLNTTMVCHIKRMVNRPSCECASIPAQTIGEFWEALASVVHGSFEKASAIHVQSYRTTKGAKLLIGRVSSISRTGSR